MKSEILKISFFALIFGLSFLVILDDLKRKKINNKLILIGIIVGLTLFSLGLFFGMVEFIYLKKAFLNALLSLIIVYVFWFFSFWPAGDAKFFALLCFLLPLDYYGKNQLPLFPSMTLFINTFVCAFVVLSIQELFEEKGIFKFNIKEQFPFSPWIFGGLMITVFLQSNVTQIVMEKISRMSSLF